MELIKCSECPKPAEILDEVYNVYFCRRHAHHFDVFDGAYSEIEQEVVE